MRSSRSTISASTSSSAADEPAVTMTRSGATVDAVVIAHSGARSPRAAPAGRAPTCSRCRPPAMARLRGGDHRRRRREIRLADFHVDDRCVRRPRARARPSAPPSRGTARSRRRGRRSAMRDSIESRSRGASAESAIVTPARIATNAMRSLCARSSPCRRARGARRAAACAQVYKCAGDGTTARLPGRTVPAGQGAAQFRQPIPPTCRCCRCAPPPGSTTRPTPPAPAPKARAPGRDARSKARGGDPARAPPSSTPA